MLYPKRKDEPKMMIVVVKIKLMLMPYNVM